MKKTFKFLVSTVTVVAVLATSVISALAAPTGTITVDNPQAGKTYSAYKIFNADVNGDSVKYTIVGEMTDDNNKALFGDDTPFQVDASNVVTVKDGTEESAVIDFLKATVKAPAFTSAASMPTPANGDPVQFTLDYGYYFINTGAGSAVTITTVKGNATIIDKGDKPTWNPNPNDPSDTTKLGKFVADKAEGPYSKESTSGINENQNTEFFLISAHCPKYAGTNVVKSYYFTDTLPDGLTYNNDAELYIDGSSTPTTDNFSVDTSTDGTIVFTYTVPDGYEGADLVIKYTTTTNGDAEYENVNTADMDWTYVPYNPDPDATEPTPSDTNSSTYPGNNPETIPNPDYNPELPVDPDSNPETKPNPDYDPDCPPTPETQTTTTYVYAFQFEKVKGEAPTETINAKFKLYDADSNEMPVVEVEAGKYRLAEKDEDPADYIVAGSVVVFGLDLGEYQLVEEEAPSGYNKLDTPVSVNIIGDVAVLDLGKIENHKGSFLPSTGGMGTTIFIVAGSVLMAGGFIGFITKKRMSLKEEEQ